MACLLWPCLKSEAFNEPLSAGHHQQEADGADNNEFFCDAYDDKGECGCSRRLNGGPFYVLLMESSTTVSAGRPGS